VRAGQRTKFCAFVLASVLCAVPAAFGAEVWPGTRPLRFEVVTAAGGLPDLVPRRLSNYLSASIGVPVVVENRPGGGGNIAAAFVARAEPDGHMVLVTSTNETVNPTLLPNPGFDYARGLVPVSMMADSKMLLVAAPAFPAKTITDVIAIGKRKPKSVSIAIPTVGSPNHLGAEMLAQYGDIDLTFVPYESISQVIPDLLANRVDLAVGAVSSVLPQVRSGALNALAVLSPQRTPLAPEIPTSAEAGLPQMQIDAWICIMAPGGTPAPIIARLDGEIAKALALPEVRADFAKLGIEIFYMNSQELGKFLRSEAVRFNSLLKHSRVVKLPR
jgi:tripartite-type tricarboxylate transporter receptor subunit TctC